MHSCLKVKLKITLFFILWTGFEYVIAMDSQQAAPTERPRLVRADSLIGLVVNDRDVRELRGDVQIIQGEAFIFCDRAKWWEDDDKILLAGDVRIFDGEHTLEADRVDYDGKAKTETATGHASLVSGNRRIEADRLVYSQESGIMTAHRHVVFTDFLERATLRGHEAVYERESDYGRMTGKSRLVRTDSTSGEEMIVDGHIMEVWSEENRVVVTDSVQMNKGDLSASCRKAEYLSDENRLLLEEMPLVLHRNQEMRGTRIDVLLEGIEFKGGVIHGDAEIVSVDTSYKDILTGQTITIEAEKDTIRKVIVEGQATSVYHVQDEERGEEGVNTVSGDRIVIGFQGTKLARVLVESDPGQCTGVYEAESRSEASSKEESSGENPESTGTERTSSGTEAQRR